VARVASGARSRRVLAAYDQPVDRKPMLALRANRSTTSSTPSWSIRKAASASVREWNG
jgi:hypothetical protein